MGAPYKHGQHGFTIVETMLVLGISSLMAVLLMGGWTVSLNNQRYKDSVKSVQSFLQEQYNLVANVENGRVDTLNCSYTGGAYTFGESAASGVPRGQSNCVILGRYISTSNSTDFTVKSIIGLEPSGAAASAADSIASDNESIESYNPTRYNGSLTLGLSSDSLNIPWQANIVVGGPGSASKNYAIAIIRSPLTGTVHTYKASLSGDAFPSLNELVNKTNERDDLTMCLDPGAPFTGGGQGVVIRGYAASQSAVETVAGGTCA